MNKDNLPQKVDPFRFADNANSLSGSLLIKDMPRLVPSLHDDQGQVAIDMTFGVDEQGLRFVKGKLATSVTLQCQRCMEPYKYDIIGGFLSGILRTEEEAKQLPERYDPLIVSDGSLVILDMVEEELIISLPIVPMHDEKDCQATLPFVAGEPIASDTGKDNPFNVIELLRKKRDVNKE